MKVILLSIGSIGDLNPYLGLGLALRARGHQVVFVANPIFESLVQKVGLDFVALGSAEEHQAFHSRRDIWSFSKSWKAALRWGALGTMHQTYKIISKHYAPGETVVAAPGLAFGARVAQEQLGVPLATLHLEPDKLRSAYQSPVMPPPFCLQDWVPRISKRCQFWIADKFVIDPVLAPELNAWRSELALPPVDRIVARWWHSPQRVIGLFPEWFAPPQPDWPDQTELTEFPLWDQGTVTAVPTEVQEFLDAGTPPLVFTAGSANQHSRGFYEAGADCCRLLGQRGIFLTKARDQLPAELPDGVRQFTYVPLGYLLGRSAALVHHAGAGTASLALAAGVPQLVMPMTFAQPDIAVRLKRLGVAQIIPPRRFHGPRVARAVESLITSTRVAQQCQRWKAALGESHPFDRTCELLEALRGTDQRR